MKAIILNSGVGSRLGEYTKEKTKCMVTVKDDISIIAYQLEHLKEQGIEEIIITTGYRSEVLEKHIQTILHGMKIVYVHNSEFQTTNYIKSLDLIEDEINDMDDILLMHGDLIFHPQVIKKLLQSKESAMVIDRSLPLPEKDFKAKMNGDGVEAIGINYFGTHCVAAQPLYKLNSQDWKRWRTSIHDFCINGNDKVYAEEALNCILDTMTLKGVDMAGLLCMEIDNQEDLHQVRRMLED